MQRESLANILVQFDIPEAFESIFFNHRPGINRLSPAHLLLNSLLKTATDLFVVHGSC